MDLGIAVYVLAGITLLNLIYYFFFARLSFSKHKEVKVSTEATSVIVCSKNEQENLKKLIPLLLEQDHPNFEIILINDASIDDTLDVIEEFQELDPRVKKVNVVNNESFWGNKKYALTLGIKKALHNNLVFIDADCRPASKQWLSHMASQLASEKTIVLGYGGYIKKKNSLLNALVRFETGITAIQYMSYALHGNPYMGVGRNLAYTSQQFYEVRGFMDHMNVLGGDDDLFVNQAATSKNTTVSLDPASFTTSLAKNSWDTWWTQKRRHVNTSKYYKKKHQFLLGLFYLSQLGFIATSIVAFVFGNWMVALVIVLFRYMVVWIVVGRGLLRFRESGIMYIIPILELLLIFSQLGLYISNKINPPKRWK